jgi:hypothetical protein
MVARCLSRELDRLPVRCDAGTLLAWIAGRSPAPSLGPW